MNPVRVLVVDDSATMRQIVTERLMADGSFDIVGCAATAAEARQAIKELNPDVMTLDIEMPEMDGLSFLQKVMRLRPMPVVMVSTLTAKGSEAAIAALALGAVDCVVKPTPGNPRSFDELACKVKTAANVSLVMQSPRALHTPTMPKDYRPADKIVAIGSSTGGVEALIRLLASFPENCAPTIITQHMPAQFTTSFAARLDRLCKPKVTEARAGDPMLPGHVYVAPGGNLHLEVAGREALICVLRPGEPVNGHSPSVDVLFQSAARAAGPRTVGVILTGMGRDGAQGLLALRQAGARTIGQDEASCVVYGMPKAALELGAVGKQLPLDQIGPEIVSITNMLR